MSLPECVASGDHEWHGSSQCAACGARLRCFCGVFIREDRIDAHMPKCPWILRQQIEEISEMEQSWG